MKTMKLIPTVRFIGLFLMFGTYLYGQDPHVVAPSIYKRVVLENENVRVLELEIAPGEIVPWHSHPNHVAYALTDAKLEITDKGKAPVVADIKAGEAMYIPAVTHMAKNLGTAPAKIIVTEIRNNKKKMNAHAVTAVKKE
ncbi:cupin domain-containing protein [Flavobacterium humi]|uniref:Cupin domain-containing protein n=1 Tax=Flavobacterium humi TaxID=2562683 RepID=A0A4Z0LD54_9FLAO|nr:cupin domain-containing protein [Flavobacterium humi]TGD59811.1 cupin domain-containing protein [Flavobacterium humi]